MLRIQAMCMREVMTAKSDREAFNNTRTRLLGIIGGSNQPIGT
jgi:hypothetical protein